jgi:hypothetical protein
MMRRWGVGLLVGFWCLLAHGADFVVVVSVDGLGSVYLERLLAEGRLPQFKRLQVEGVSTLNARSDADVTVTLPNHTTMMTARPVRANGGHGWTSNVDPAPGATIHSNRGAYVTSVFDVVHDSGRRTGLWATKPKFSLFSVSYDSTNGAPDAVGEDHGRDKVDVFVREFSSPDLTRDFISCMSTQPCQFAFVHFNDGDATGHAQGWGSNTYNEAMVTIDGCVGQIMDLIDHHPRLKGKTTLIVTADHGGQRMNHQEADAPANYTIPFFVWGDGVVPGDLYTFNEGARSTPGTGRPGYEERPQPIRNGDAANLALRLLGLGPIPGSVINPDQDLRIAPAVR